MPDWQRQATVDRSATGNAKRELLKRKVDAPIVPTVVSFLCWLGTMSCVLLRLAHTSAVLCTSSTCGCECGCGCTLPGERGSRSDARAPKKRPRTGRIWKRRIPRIKWVVVQKRNQKSSGKN